MIKAILADDEDIIREGISSFIDWDSLGIKLVGQASNGVEARELIEVACPEIIITDVKMPRMSGIELLALAKEKQPDCIVIMISSYDQFEYAQQSLNLGAFAYILKPIDTDKLIALLKEAVEKIKKQSSQKQILDTYKDVLEQTQLEVLDNKLKAMVFGGNTEGLTEGEKDYLKKFQHFIVVSVHADKPVFHEEAFTKELEKKLEKWISQQEAEIKRFRNQSRMTIFCILQKEKKEISYSRLCYIYGQYYREAVLGISMKADSVESLAEAYKQSMEAAEYRFFVEETVIFYENVNQQMHFSFQDMPDWSRQVRDCLKGKTEGKSQEEAVREITNRFLTYMYEKKPSGFMVRAAVSAILLELLHGLREQGGKPEDLFLNVSDAFVSILNERNPALQVEKLYEALHSGAEYISRLEKLKPNSVVYKARRYIEGNYQNPNLRIDDVANHVFINPSYFSTIFSRECQISFGDYLTKIRMEKALQLLKTTNQKVYEIAEQVGYQNVSWFNVAFKKYTGMKPGDVRK
ncbi:response regulator [Lachnospiraceae bacterium 62-35]